MYYHPLTVLEGFDPSYTLVYFDEWSDWEEGGWIAIHEKDGQYYVQEYQSSVMCESRETWSPEPVSEDEAMELMLRWEKNH